LKFLFLLGPYRPGCCGISDYVTILSEKLEALGHECHRISIDPEKGSTIAATATSLPPSDLVNFQFSPYSLHPRGLPGHHLLKLGKTLSKQCLHLTFHEIWIGAYPRASWKERLLGRLQRKSILDFIKASNPEKIFTTNSAAKDRLTRSGLKPNQIYLCGTIPRFVDSSKSKDISSIQQKNLIIFFGTPYYNFPYKKFLKKIDEEFQLLKRNPRICVLGGTHNQSGLKILRKEATRKKINVEETGLIASEEISRKLQSAALGVSTTPFDAIGKSSATAAMLEHGLPVIAHDDGDTPEEALFAPGPFKERIVLLEDKDFSSRLRELLETSKPSFFDGVNHTAESFLRSLSSAA